ncbi:MAG: SAM-dependent DNA methyltransferase, partial [Candidatus Heimdallarchaeota archaeon]
MSRRKGRRIIEFGDFQTPSELAIRIVNHLNQLGISPASIIEPTCGIGSFILAALKIFPTSKIMGMDINSKHLDLLLEELVRFNSLDKVEIDQVDFFTIDWSEKISFLPEPILVLGNPPWVTSSEISAIGGTNIPVKNNIHGYQGLDAKTGKSNFDISEWMIIELLQALNRRQGTLAMLCKVAVARKVLMHAKKENMTLSSSAIYLINAHEFFGSSVEACLFLCHLKPDSYNYSCQVYQNIGATSPIQEIGYINENLVANMPLYDKWKHLQGETTYVWRSGIKHDCSKVMELRKRENQFTNGFGEEVFLEEEYLYPMLKSSDLANNRVNDIERWMIVTQKAIGEETSVIQQKAPLTWKYLEKYAHLLEKRASSVYQNRPQYSLFGVGSYTFSPFKVAISG